MPPLAEAIQARATELKISLADEVTDQLVRYWELLEKWDRHSNLTALSLTSFSPSSIDRLLMEPLVAASLLTNLPLRWFDFGSGGGSPAVPMKVALPASTLIMVESRWRKCVFLQEVVERLLLPGASVFIGRIETLPTRDDTSADLVTVRALKFEGDVAGRAYSILREGGKLMLFGTDATPSLTEPPFRHVASVALPSSVSSLHCFEKQ